MTKIETQFLGFTLQSPLIAASGPMSRDYTSIKRLKAAGIGAVITKTILLIPSINPQPCLYRGNGYFLNTERCSTISLKQWLSEELPRLKQLDIPIIASIGMTPADVEKLARPVVKAGADMLELAIFTSYDDPTPMIEAVRRVKKAVDVPVSVKLSHNVYDIVEFGEAVREAGADVISAIDAVKSGLHLDLRMGHPGLLEQGFGRISGEAIKPLALYDVGQLAHYVKLPIIGTGGIMSGIDALEMISCGAAAVGICTEDHGISSLEELQGRVLAQIDFPKSIEERQEYEKRPVKSINKVAFIDQRVCTKCQICYRICFNGAVEKGKERFLIRSSICEGCGLCISMCPVEAISYHEKGCEGA
jgi:dihydroorotate dehydrogenase (fumarate)